MKILEVVLLMNGVLWFASVIFLIYAFGITILRFSNVQTLFIAVFLIIAATLAELILAVLND